MCVWVVLQYLPTVGVTYFLTAKCQNKHQNIRNVHNSEVKANIFATVAQEGLWCQ